MGRRGRRRRSANRAGLSYAIRVMLDEYRGLRAEILTSIRLQHTTFAFAGVFIATLLGLSFVEERFRLLLVAIPPTFITFSFLWLIEQSRMMRAGNYLEIVERRLNKMLMDPKNPKVYVSWENWLRRKGVPRLDPHRIHHYAQYGTVFGLFLWVNLVAIYSMNDYAVIPQPYLTMLTGIYLGLMILALILIGAIIIHRRESVARIPVEPETWDKEFASDVLKSK